jgi:hypothetical protein
MRGNRRSVICFFMALLSSCGINTPSLPAQGEQRRSSIFNISRDIPPSVVPISVDRDAAIKAYSCSISGCCAPFRVGVHSGAETHFASDRTGARRRSRWRHDCRRSSVQCRRIGACGREA